LSAQTKDADQFVAKQFEKLKDKRILFRFDPVLDERPCQLMCDTSYIRFGWLDHPDPPYG
jgi:hypothetical protein